MLERDEKDDDGQTLTDDVVKLLGSCLLLELSYNMIISHTEGL